MQRPIWFLLTLLAAVPLLGQPSDFVGVISHANDRRVLAVPDLPGDGAAQPWMATLNQTLWTDLEESKLFKLVPKTLGYTRAPRQPSDFRTRAAGDTSSSGGGLWLSDWASPPPSAGYLAFGYADIRGGANADQLVLHGWLYDVRAATPALAQMIQKFYLGPVNAASARKVAHEFAADIITRFGGMPTFGSRIYFRSNRTGHSEIWAMDTDGSNLHQITNLQTSLLGAAVSPDGSKIALSRLVKTPAWRLALFSLDSLRELSLASPSSQHDYAPSFTPDGKQIVYSSNIKGCCQIAIAGLDGRNPRPITSLNSIDTEPKVNPRNGRELVFVSGRSGPQQIYRTNLDGTDLERLTPGTGEASNPAWHPDGQHLAYSWTKGYQAGKFNIFIMDAANQKYIQLTHDEGRNENPSWAPDGIHLVFTSTRSGSKQLWIMAADGLSPRQLTGLKPGEGANDMAVWSK